MIENFEPLIKLPDDEKKAYNDFIHHQRQKCIGSAKEEAKKAIIKNRERIEKLIAEKNISQVIADLRELAYNEFLKEESIFTGIVLGEIGKRFQTPHTMLENASKQIYQMLNKSSAEFCEIVSNMFGVYAGQISPYIYALCLSNTQSRRSRAGKVFEAIIYHLYEYFNFPYESQSQIGKKTFEELKLGKMVDSIIPSKQAFLEFRGKTIIGSMKTTLRERWQEVVEESVRSNLPNIYLLTVDTDIPVNKVKQMSHHNMVLVVLDIVKKQEKFQTMRNIISYEKYFFEEIPEILQYWNKV